MINRKSVLLLVLVITSVVTKEVGSSGHWANETANIGSVRKLSRTRKFTESDSNSSDEYFTILPTQKVQLGMVPYLPIPSVSSINVETEQSSKNFEITEMSSTTKGNDLKLSKTVSQSSDEHLQFSDIATRSQLSLYTDSTVTASSQLIEFTEITSFDLIVTTNPVTKTVFHEKTHYVSAFKEVTVTSTVQELLTLMIYKEKPTLISLDLIEKIEQLINRIAIEKLESQERPQASEEKKHIVQEGMEDLRKLEVIQKSLQVGNDPELVNEPPDGTEDISMIVTVNTSFPFPKTPETEEYTISFEPTSMVSFKPEPQETFASPFPSPINSTPKSLARKSVKDILNQLPSRKVMIEPQFQDHPRNPDIHHIPKLPYNKPKLHWLNNNTPGHETLENIEKDIEPIILEDEDYMYEVPIVNGPFDYKNTSRDEIEGKLYSDKATLISTDEGTLLPRVNSTTTSSYFENEIFINGADNTTFTSLTTFETSFPTNLSNYTYPPSSPFIIDETPSNVNTMFDIGYEEMAAKRHRKHHLKKNHTKLDFEDICNLESFAWTQAPCLSSYFAGIVLIVFLVS